MQGSAVQGLSPLDTSPAAGVGGRRRRAKGNTSLHRITAQLRNVGLDSNGGTSEVRRDTVSNRGLMKARGRKLDELIGIGSWIDDAAADIFR
jgi:hypothetical protein